jgi:RimJ/RimL family protein N-acetyltransferase
MAGRLETERLALRPWQIDDDAQDALTIYGEHDVARWLSPAMDRVAAVAQMRLILEKWVNEDRPSDLPCGRWAIERREDRQLIGAAVLLPLPPRNEDLELGWQLRRDAWGHGYATEVSHVLARWAFDEGVDEVFAVVHPANTRAQATVRRVGMEWVGETEKYYDLRLHVYRLRRSDLDSGPFMLRPPAVEYPPPEIRNISRSPRVTENPVRR